MQTKLTLSVDVDVIARAKLYAKKTGRSLSELVQHYLETVTREEPTGDLSPRLKKLVGVVQLPEDFHEDTIHREAIERKHL